MNRAVSRLTSAVLGALLLVAGFLLIPHPTAQAATAADGSSVTVAGTGPFEKMRVTVSQTAQLSSQVINVSWTGAAPTLPISEADVNYVHVMQCWGDDPAGPPPEQCEFGQGQNLGGPDAGSYVKKRSISPDDPLEKTRGRTVVGDLPFRGADGRTVDGGPTPLSAAFTAHESNELPIVRTGLDGTGSASFFVQTGLDSSALGCGATPAGAAQPHKCWLVVVPRNNIDVDGRTATVGRTDLGLQSSPLSATNWQYRIAVPLDFTPVGGACQIGADERPVAGTEIAIAAVGRWQAGFCLSGGSSLSYGRHGDNESRNALAGPNPQLRLVGAEEAPPLTGLPYAPVALDGVTFAFLVERQPKGSATEEIKALSGRQYPPIKLNQRLAAKLLTQAYVSIDPAAVDGNPSNVTRDPEFLALNPAFDTAQQVVYAPLVVTGTSDATKMLWKWITADPEARAFLGGKPDQWGTHLNKRYAGTTFPRDDVPRADTFCGRDPHSAPPTKGQPLICSIAKAPYANDMESAARAVFRGEVPVKDVWDSTTRLYSGGTQAVGTRSLSAVVDIASATRYGLSMAELRNSAGEFVAPSAASMGAAAAAMKPGVVPGTLVLDEQHVPANAYPLTMYTYATTTPGKLTPADAKTYADFIRFAGTKGQICRPGLCRCLHRRSPRPRRRPMLSRQTRAYRNRRHP